MGDIAEGLINGDFDFFTGEYIGRGGGFPRTLDGSLPWEQNQRNPHTNRVMAYLMKKGVRQHEVEKIFRKYAAIKGFEIVGKHYIRKCSIKIQEDWNGFCNWYAQNKNTPTH